MLYGFYLREMQNRYVVYLLYVFFHIFVSLIFFYMFEFYFNTTKYDKLYKCKTLKIIR